MTNTVVRTKLKSRNQGKALTSALGAIADMAGKPVRIPASRSDKTGRKLNLKAVAEILAEEGLDPTRELVKVIKSGTLDDDVKARLLTTLMEYIHPKKKSVEITGADGGPIQVEQISDAVLLKIAMSGEVIEGDVQEVQDVEPK